MSLPHDGTNFGIGTLAEPEGPADPRGLVLAGLQALRLHQRVGVLVPAAIRKIMPEYRGRRLRLVGNAERHIGFRKPQKRFFDVTRSLIAGDHHLESIDRSSEFAPLQLP